MTTTSQKALINLLRGWPAPALLPASTILSAGSTALNDPLVSTTALQYGADWGYNPLRSHLATWLTDFYKPASPVTTSRLCITGGASQNLAVILQGFTDPIYTRYVWMVSPTYFMCCPIFHDAGFYKRLRSVPEDSEGIDIEYLKDGLRKAEEEAMKTGNDRPRFKHVRDGINKIYKHVIYCVPTFANPSAKTMSLRRRTELVEVAREFDALVVTDDVYDFLQWRTDCATDAASEKYPQSAAQPRLVDIDSTIAGGTDRSGADGFGNTVSNASFSKIAGPGVRCGWAEGTPKFAHGLSQTGAQKSGGAPSQMTSTFLSEMLSQGKLQKHIQERLQPAYAKRYKLMVDTVKESLGPLGVVISEPCESTNTDSATTEDSTSDMSTSEPIDTPTSSAFSDLSDMAKPSTNVAGGYFLYLHLPKGVSAKTLTYRCKDEENLMIGGGTIFAVYGDEDAMDLSRDVRLSFSWVDEDDIVEGVERMASALKRMLDDGSELKDDVEAVDTADYK